MDGSALRTCERPLAASYDVALLDLDGVVYRGRWAIDGVPERLAAARAHGQRLAFVTNNASRTPDEVVGQLRELGIDVGPADVVTSAQAAARVLAERLPAQARVLVVGGRGLEEALTEQGLQPVRDRSGVSAVVQGFAPDVSWRSLAQAAYAVAAGALWVAANLDRTIPTADGVAPGNGTLVAAVEAAVGRGPDAVAGKPARPLFDESVRRTGAERPLVVGDRLDTDIAGAAACSADALLVLTGVTDLAALWRARPPQRPAYVSRTLDGLLGSHAVPRAVASQWELAGWRMGVRSGRLEVVATGTERDDGIRVGCAACWSALDTGAAEVDDTAALALLADP